MPKSHRTCRQKVAASLHTPHSGSIQATHITKQKTLETQQMPTKHTEKRQNLEIPQIYQDTAHRISSRVKRDSSTWQLHASHWCLRCASSLKLGCASLAIMCFAVTAGPDFLVVNALLNPSLRTRIQVTSDLCF